MLARGSGEATTFLANKCDDVCLLAWWVLCVSGANMVETPGDGEKVTGSCGMVGQVVSMTWRCGVRDDN